MDSTVRCETCGRLERVDFASCLRTGWPKCHGATMSLIRHPKDIEAATAKAIAPQRARGGE